MDMPTTNVIFQFANFAFTSSGSPWIHWMIIISKVTSTNHHCQLINIHHLAESNYRNYPLVIWHSYRKSPFSMGKSTINGHFHSYVCLPEGSTNYIHHHQVSLPTMKHAALHLQPREVHLHQPAAPSERWHWWDSPSLPTAAMVFCHWFAIWNHGFPKHTIGWGNFHNNHQ